jgi:hypothetical protein
LLARGRHPPKTSTHGMLGGSQHCGTARQYTPATAESASSVTHSNLAHVGSHRQRTALGDSPNPANAHSVNIHMHNDGCAASTQRCSSLPLHLLPHSPVKPPSLACAAPLPLLLPVAAPAAAAALLRSSPAAPPLPALTLLLRPAVTACIEGLGPNPGVVSMAGLAPNPAGPAAAADDTPGWAWWRYAAS